MSSWANTDQRLAWPHGSRVQTPHGPGTVAWGAPLAAGLGEGRVPVNLDRPPAGTLGGTLRFYGDYELQPILT